MRGLSRLDAPGRLAGVDLARGLAVIGMFAVHLTTLPTAEWGSPSTWSGLATGRSSVLFAMLAGVSLAVAESTANSSRRLAARAVVIWGIGMALLFLDLPVEVILTAYGVLFLIGIVLLRLSTRTLWAVAAGVAVIGPVVLVGIEALPWPEDAADASIAAGRMLGWYFPFIVWAGFLAAGMAAGRVLRRGGVRDALALLGTGVVLAVVGDGIVGPIGARHDIEALSSLPHSSGIGETLGSGGFGLAVIGVCTLLVVVTPVRTLTVPLRAVGSMPLTAYTAHLLIWWVWILVDPVTGVDEFREHRPFWPITIGVIVACTAWAAIVGRGPLEDAVRRLADAVARPIGPAPEVDRR